MGEIRIVGPGKTRGYPYPVCKNKDSEQSVCSDFSVSILRLLHRVCCEAFQKMQHKIRPCRTLSFKYICFLYPAAKETQNILLLN